MFGWIWFVVVQVISLVATIIGWVLLIPFCVAQAWTTDKPDRWSFAPLNWVYGNPEDGVSGQTAKIWLNRTTQGPYMPSANSIWRAYSWSALRNSSDNLKYVFAWKDGPFYRWANTKYFFQAGFNTSGYPVFSLGRI